MKNILIVGTGYVGLVTGTCFAETGNNVICVDIDESKVNKLKTGQITIFEPGLEKLFLKNIKENRLKFTTRIEDFIENSEIIFLALPTPSGEDGSADLNYILDVAFQLGKLINNYKIIVNKSTVPVGTVFKVRKEISLNYNGDFDVVSNPEFLREGVAVEDFMKPDRVVIGTNSEKAKVFLRDLYSPFVMQGNPIIFMDEVSSELTKYAANSFLATKISFMNEISQLCEIMGANVDMVRKGIGSDERIGKRFLFPGIGYGGSCFPKDVKALIKSAEDLNYSFEILKAVENVNFRQKRHLIQKMKEYYSGLFVHKKIAIWGLSFKANTDDIRESPSLEIIKFLIQNEVNVNVYDPEAMGNVEKLFGSSINYSTNQYEALNDVDALIIATEWNEFRNPDFQLMSKKMKEKVIFDGRNLFDISVIKEAGFIYSSIGR